MFVGTSSDTTTSSWRPEFCQYQVLNRLYATVMPDDQPDSPTAVATFTWCTVDTNQSFAKRIIPCTGRGWKCDADQPTDFQTRIIHTRLGKDGIIFFDLLYF
ncbi:unnamed protein product [Enterobius vermicularis]|uniref:Secreted protein n=1 Tax=Enterobius vermicularis TaxID=51028 RepID=A0A0N4VA55_ENTVE|nr:unnamed protein product [Enterobius vermicularis]